MVAVVEGRSPRTTSPLPKIRRRRRGGKTQARWYLRSLPFLSFLVVLGLWQIGASTHFLDHDFFSSPADVYSAGYSAVKTHLFWNDVWVSGQEFVIGYVLAVVVAIPIGLFSGLFRRVQYMVDPWLSALNALPRIALIPLVVLWFGLGIESKVAVVFLGAAVSIAINTFDGARAVSRDLMDVATSYGASWPRRMVSVVIPGVLPFALVGMRLGIARAVAGVMVGEYFTSDAGLGNFIFRAGQTLQTGRLIFGALVVTLLSLGAFRAIAAVERRFHRWRPRVGSAE